MDIIVYVDSLKTYTSGMSHRGILIELIKQRKKDFFKIIYRKGKLSSHFIDFINLLAQFKNLSIIVLNETTRWSNIQAFFQNKNHCIIKNISGDIFLNFDSQLVHNSDKPNIITVHDLSCFSQIKFSSLSFLNRISRRFTIRNGIINSHKIVSISNFTKNQIIDLFDIDHNKIDVIYNGIDSKWFEKKMVSEIENYLLWYGNFNSRKNILNLVKAYRLLFSENDINNIPKLVMIGSKKGKYYKKVLKLINSFPTEIKEKIVIESNKNLNDLINCVSKSIGVVFPSYYEGFGLPIIESFSRGKNILISDVTSMPEMGNGLNLTCNPNSVKSIYEGIKNLIKNDINPEKLISYSKNFSFSLAASRYSALISKLINDK